MGRDISVISSNASSLNAVVRSIIGTENKADMEEILSMGEGNISTDAVVRFSLAPHKVFLFDKETEDRIYL